ncbi:hypothetical protein V9T40_014164 [Parthenolecanium corni]|uniref:Echinoderm microtubule-associated protein-like 2 n=1 Tax=Parthenolecanium corni TaxID=536013 RepID=A0AAN9TTE0_9HEMI
MIETENESLGERLAYLEKKVLAQNDEIVCLRSTLADVLRRLTQLEGSRSLSTPPAKNGLYRSINQHTVGAGTNTRDGLRYRPHSEIIPTREPVRRVASHSSSLPQRRGMHYQSTGSLHSDSQSSSSVSPIPMSPAPSPTRPNTANYLKPPTPIPSTNLYNSKKWSSTGDFNQVQCVNITPSVPVNRLSTKSLFNLHTRPLPSQNLNMHLKHGTRESSYNSEEGSFRMYLRGRPVSLYAPSELIDSYDISKVTTPPQARLNYGYRGKDCRSNLYLLPTGEIVYFVAAVAVLYNSEEQSQRHYFGHTDDIKCLAIHPNKLLVATGQTAGHEVREGKDGGSFLCAVDEANDHNISIWDWQRNEKGHRITETKCSMDTVVAAEFHPLDKNSIVTCGKNHISFWVLDAGGTLYKRQGLFEGSRDRPKYVTCLAFTQTGDVLSGDTNGNIIIWNRGKNTIQKVVKNVHEGSVFSICVLKEGSIITGGGKDGRIVQFDSNLQPTGFEAQIAEHLGGIRALSEGRGSQLLVGSTKNCILMGSLSLGFSPVVLGHTDELWALATHPDLPQFLTAGFDNIVQLWDAMSHTVVWSKDIAEQVQSAAFSSDGSILIVGCVSGKWLVMDSETREIYSVHTDGSEPIQVVKFSPDGKLLALGSRDNYIYIYHVGDDGRKYSRVGKCSVSLTRVGWELDGNPGVCRQITQSTQMRDISWASNSCTITFQTVGIWPEGADGTDVNACEVSHDKKLLVSGDDFGKVKLYSYPAAQPKSLPHAYGGHSSHVTNVAFLYDDMRVISVGGNDTSVLQWAIN